MAECGRAMIKTSWKKANEDDEKDDYSSITPTGFKQQKYNTNTIPGGYLYHRCHIIAWKLGGIDVDKRNIMTGTQSFNINGMKQFEDQVYNYLKENQTNHVLYRVTPYFEGENKLANGVNIEAYSIEDNGKLQFNVYVYNVQPYVVIDYKTGENWEGDEIAEPEGKWADGTEAEPSDTKEQMYILNKNTKKFHKPECSGAKKIKAKNKGEYTGSRQTLIDEGYEPCGNCNP